MQRSRSRAAPDRSLDQWTTRAFRVVRRLAGHPFETQAALARDLGSRVTRRPPESCASSIRSRAGAHAPTRTGGESTVVEHDHADRAIGRCEGGAASRDAVSLSRGTVSGRVVHVRARSAAGIAMRATRRIRGVGERACSTTWCARRRWTIRTRSTFLADWSR